MIKKGKIKRFYLTEPLKLCDIPDMVFVSDDFGGFEYAREGSEKQNNYEIESVWGFNCTVFVINMVVTQTYSMDCDYYGNHHFYDEEVECSVRSISTIDGEYIFEDNVVNLLLASEYISKRWLLECCVAMFD